MNPRVTITRTRQGRVRMEFPSADFARMKRRLQDFGRTEAAGQVAVNRFADAAALSRMEQAIGKFEIPKYER